MVSCSTPLPVLIFSVFPGLFCRVRCGTAGLKRGKKGITCLFCPLLLFFIYLIKVRVSCVLCNTVQNDYWIDQMLDCSCKKDSGVPRPKVGSGSTLQVLVFAAGFPLRSLTQDSMIWFDQSFCIAVARQLMNRSAQVLALRTKTGSIRPRKSKEC